MPENRITLVTGAGAGIGRAIALELSRRGYGIVAVGRRKGQLEELVSALAGPGFAAPFDVARNETLLSALPPDWREVEVLVNNAGSDAGGRRPFHTATCATA